MFFYYFDIETIELIKHCFNRYVKRSFEIKGYCDVSVLFSDSFSKKNILDSSGVYSEKITALYKEKFPKSKDDLYIVSDIFADKYNYSIIDYKECFAILFWCFKIFKSTKTFEKNKDEIMEQLMSFLHEDLTQKNYDNLGTIIYDNTKTITHLVESVSDFLKVLDSYSKEETLYFRGHSKTTYNLKPSILRSDKMKENESLIYQELLISCPDEFRGFERHIDFLVKMQHYGLPTRLLDITRNPLVALYFACCNNPTDFGEIFIFSPNQKQIKYENSDTISMLATLPLFSYQDQIDLMDYLYKPNGDKHIVERFVHEIQTEKPGFEDKIKWSDLESCFVILTKKDNNRIIKQDGAFIICGVNDNPERIINDNLRLKSKDKNILVFVKEKNKILKELDLLSINKSTLFPEIDSVSEYIKSKYCN